MASGRHNDLNKLRMAQFESSSKSDNLDTEYVCWSPSRVDKTKLNPKVVFLSDSDEDKTSLPDQKVDFNNDNSSQLIEVSMHDSNHPRSSRKRKKVEKQYSWLSNSSDEEISHSEATKRKNPAKKSTYSRAKFLSLKPLPIAKKTAVVVPITKLKPESNASCCEKEEKNSTCSSSTPKKQTPTFALLDELLNSPVKPKIIEDNCYKCNDSSSTAEAKISSNEPGDSITNCSTSNHREKSSFYGTTSPSSCVDSKLASACKVLENKTQNNAEICSSDSDLSLFEISFDQSESIHSTKHIGKSLNDQILHNPPPSPVDQAASSPSKPSSPIVIPENPLEIDFTSSSDENSGKRKSSKGKQPANKRRKVVAKRSKPTADQDIEIVDPLSRSHSAALTKKLTSKSSIDGGDTPCVASSASSSGTTNRGDFVNKAVVRPNPVVIPDNDDDDDIMMVSTNTRNRQELEDLEFARRLQAQFDQESASIRAPIPIATTPSSSRAHFDTTAPLTQSSERLLQVLGGSPAVTQFLSSPSTLQRRNVPRELATVEQRLELLQELALQQEYLDDTTLSEILGVTPGIPSHTSPVGTTSQGPRPTNFTGFSSRSRADVMGRNSGSFNRIMREAFGVDDTAEMSYESLLELSDRIGDARMSGLAANVIDMLPTRTYAAEDTAAASMTCHICMCDFATGDKLRTLNCFHEYHCQCIDQWLKKKATCPICRARVCFD